MEDSHKEYERLIMPIEDKMIKSVWQITHNSNDAQDAFQDALMKIWKNIKKIKRHPNPHALILRICANSAYDILRKKPKHKNLEESFKNSSNHVSTEYSNDESHSINENRSEIIQAITKLSNNQAIAVTMRYIQDLPYRDIAQALGCKEVTVRKHISRARNRLGKLLAHLLPNPQKEVKK